jgi:starch synthase
MKILFLAAEVAPYVSVGGLSQVMYFLPRSLMKRGHGVSVFTAKYGMISPKPSGRGAWRFKTEARGLKVPIRHDNGLRTLDAERLARASHRDEDALTYGGAAGKDSPTGGASEAPSFEGSIACDILSVRGREGDPTAYFVDNKEYFELRSNVFGYADDHTRFALLSKACLEWLLRQHELRARGDHGAYWPDVIHCHDWHASYFIELARHDKRYKDALASVPIVLTVHNFRYQGNADFRRLPEAERDTGTEPLAPLTSEALQKQNILMRGLLLADAITTVSPTHAAEVLTPEYAEGLEDTLKRVKGKFGGILNGIDTGEFDPARDPAIYKRFTRFTFVSARAANKRHLQRLFSLSVDTARPLLASVGRLTSQKGWDLFLQMLPPLLEERRDVQFVVLGTGNEAYQDGLLALQRRFPEQVGLHLKADFSLPRKIFSGADALLIPSSFEPGGIVALEALRYGAVPIVRRTGGLNDSVQDFVPVTGKGNGFSFVQKSPWALYGAVVEALTVFRQPRLWQKAVRNGLTSDFSWDHAAKEYDAWYAGAVKRRSRSRKRH